VPRVVVCFSDHAQCRRSRRFRGPPESPVLAFWGGIPGSPGKPGFGFLGWDSGDLRVPSCPLWLILFFVALCRCTLSQTPTPHRRFVENKSQTLIRKACRQAVDLSFSRFFGLESRCLCLVSACHSQFVPIVSLFAGEYPANHIKA
jgi:hypothetical protein